MDKLDYIEGLARGNAAFHVASAELLAKEANATLLLMLSGGGGALALAVSLYEKAAPDWLWVGVAAASAYLFLLAAVLVIACLWVRPIWPTGNEPQNLLSVDWSLDTLREAELRSQQRSIDRNRIRNDQVGAWLNRVRGAATALPLVLAISAAFVIYR